MMQKNKGRTQRKNEQTRLAPPTNLKIDYKEVLTLKRFSTERGKIIPQKYTGISAKDQRALGREIKKARFMALLPYTERHSI